MKIKEEKDLQLEIMMIENIEILRDQEMIMKHKQDMLPKIINKIIKESSESNYNHPSKY